MFDGFDGRYGFLNITVGFIKNVIKINYVVEKLRILFQVVKVMYVP